MFVNRYYQDEAIERALKNKNGIICASTGAGKSIIISGIVKKLYPEKVLVLQPNAVILKSNISKVHLAGLREATAYSMSYGEKEMSNVVYATIGSIIKKLHLFSDFKNIIIDEAHNVNPKGGMYEKLIKELSPKKLIGLTATPYRSHPTMEGVETRIITRTRPKLFNKIIYNISTRSLIDQGFLTEPEFIEIKTDRSMLRENSTGGDYTDKSLEEFAKRNKLNDKACEIVKDNINDYKSFLIFCDSIKSNKEIVNKLSFHGIECCEVSSETKKSDRDDIMSRFDSGELKVVTCVGTLTTGFDKPNLECVIDARPIKSVALHYQKIGRIVRVFEGKKATVFDLSGNLKELGNPLNYDIIHGPSGLPDLFCGKRQISPKRNTKSRKKKPNKSNIMSFGMHKGKLIEDVPRSWMNWYVSQDNPFDKKLVDKFNVILSKEL